jgi:hypothetical protein
MPVKGMRQMFALPNAPDPQEVADAIVATVDAPAGPRPARVVVDRFSGDATHMVNDVHSQVQAGVLTGSGLPLLAEDCWAD